MSSSVVASAALPSAPRTAQPPAHLGRAVVLLAASLLAHWWVLGGMQRAADEAPAVAAPPTRTVTAVLLAPPPPPPPPAPKRVVRRAPPPAPIVAPPPVVTLPVAPEPEPVEPPAPEPAPEPALPEPAPVEVAPQTAEAVPAEPPPIVDEATLPKERVDGADLAGELAETGVLPGGLPARAKYVYFTTGSEYKVLTAETSIDWTLADDGRYEARLATVALGITALELKSTGTVNRFGLAPQRFTQKRIRRAEEAANFDWANHRVTFSARSFERELREGIQDRLSFQFQLMALAQRLPERFEPGALIEFPVAGPDGVDTYAFLTGADETLATELGDLVARKLERPRGVGGADSRIEVWLAPALNWLPVKLRFTDRRGRSTENTLLRIEDGSQAAPDAAR